MIIPVDYLYVLVDVLMLLRYLLWVYGSLPVKCPYSMLDGWVDSVRLN